MQRHGIIVSPEGGLGATFNPAAVKLEDGRHILLVRSVPKGYEKLGPVNQFDNNYTSHISQWESLKPEEGFKLVKENAIGPGDSFDKFGVEDPRITKIGDTYYIFYTSLAIGLGEANAGDGVRIAMASTKDFETYKKHGVIGPDRRSKAGVLFESEGKLSFMWKDEAHAERTMMSDAPKDFENAAAWQEFWKTRDIDADQLLGPQKNAHEGLGVEPGAPPIEIEEGLLLAYSSISSDFHWTVSLLLLDKKDPSIVLAKSDLPFLTPTEPYEVKGDVNNVVFPCGALIDNGRLYVYYGGADTVCAVASESMDAVRKSLKPVKPAAPKP